MSSREREAKVERGAVRRVRWDRARQLQVRGYTLAEIGAALGVSGSRASQILAQAAMAGRAGGSCTDCLREIRWAIDQCWDCSARRGREGRHRHTQSKMRLLRR
jgi:hypothetical protein